MSLAIDGELMALLLQNKAIKKHFFTDVKGVMIFDKVAFQSFVSNKQFLPDSYTAFKNKIGLTANGEYLAQSKEVVLSWPGSISIIDLSGSCINNTLYFWPFSIPRLTIE